MNNKNNMDFLLRTPKRPINKIIAVRFMDEIILEIQKIYISYSNGKELKVEYLMERLSKIIAVLDDLIIISRGGADARTIDYLREAKAVINDFKDDKLDIDDLIESMKSLSKRLVELI